MNDTLTYIDMINQNKNTHHKTTTKQHNHKNK